MSSSPLNTKFTDCVDVFKTLRSRKEIKKGFKTLLKTDFPVKMIKESDLYRIVRKIPTWPPFEKLKVKVLAKIEKLEAAYEQKTEKAEEKVNPVASKTSKFEKKTAVKKDEKPKKRPAEASGSMEPSPKRSTGSKNDRSVPTSSISSSRRPDNWIPKKRIAPTRPVTQPLKPAEPAKTAPKPTAPIITSSSCMGFRIPKKKVTPTLAPEVVKKSTEPVIDVKNPLPAAPIIPTPQPLISLALERPTWISEKVLAKYNFNR
ncbi:hypothetical protein CAEBREN_22125 [Caenorhabditis brenneri]|uniref:Uncharacterized protein n=1 Tax=Caenorhabditis brenneri TaxID=135651 RepID=G0MLS0_CAEBE|nr:hypothetical protein CAEBREN_22125 [Caenorhabditis brenneri]